MSNSGENIGGRALRHTCCLWIASPFSSVYQCKNWAGCGSQSINWRVWEIPLLFIFSRAASGVKPTQLAGWGKIVSQSFWGFPFLLTFRVTSRCLYSVLVWGFRGTGLTWTTRTVWCFPCPWPWIPFSTSTLILCLLYREQWGLALQLLILRVLSLLMSVNLIFSKRSFYLPGGDMQMQNDFLMESSVNQLALLVLIYFF